MHSMGVLSEVEDLLRVVHHVLKTRPLGICSMVPRTGNQGCPSNFFPSYGSFRVGGQQGLPRQPVWLLQGGDRTSWALEGVTSRELGSAFSGDLSVIVPGILRLGAAFPGISIGTCMGGSLEIAGGSSFEVTLSRAYDVRSMPGGVRQVGVVVPVLFLLKIEGTS